MTMRFDVLLFVPQRQCLLGLNAAVQQASVSKETEPCLRPLGAEVRLFLVTLVTKSWSAGAPGPSDLGLRCDSSG